MRVRARYAVHKVAPKVIWIVDQDDGAMSVTNDAEAVVAEVVAQHGDKRIIYRDSDGRWDELRHIDGVFIGFSPAPHMEPPTPTVQP